jgi:hypothetical protein
MQQEVGPRLGVAAMWQVVLFLTRMTLINADNVVQIRENQRNQRFFEGRDGHAKARLYILVAWHKQVIALSLREVSCPGPG